MTNKYMTYQFFNGEIHIRAIGHGAYTIYDKPQLALFVKRC